MLQNYYNCKVVIIDRVASQSREIMQLEVSVRLSSVKGETVRLMNATALSPYYAVDN